MCMQMHVVMYSVADVWKYVNVLVYAGVVEVISRVLCDVV